MKGNRKPRDSRKADFYTKICSRCEKPFMSTGKFGKVCEQCKKNPFGRKK